LSGNIEELVKNPKWIKKFIEEINKKGKEEKLLSFELVKKAKVEVQSFGTKDLLTPTSKLKRADAKKVYDIDIKRMYEEGKIEFKEKPTLWEMRNIY